MISFAEWLKKLYESNFPTHRGGKDKDWVSEDDYDPQTPVGGGQYLKNPHRHAGYLARSQGKDRTQNPHPLGSKASHDWHDGWDDYHFIHEPKNRGYGADDES